MATDIIKSEGVQGAGMNTWKASPQGCAGLGWLGGLQVRHKELALQVSERS